MDRNMKKKRHQIRAAFLLLFVVISLQLVGCAGLPTGGKTAKEPKSTNGETIEVHFLDVGQGDATLIKQGSHAMLIDAGNNDKGTAVQSYLQSQGVETLDYVVGTHPDSDHVGGLDVVLYKFPWDTVILPDLEKDTKTYQDVLKVIKDKGKSITFPVAGNSYGLGNAEFTIIAPAAEDYGDNWNDYSVGILLQFGESRFIFTGDAEEDSEQDMIAGEVDLSADVLKAAHHGSDTANTMPFLEEVSPKSVVISCGEGNSYGHPRAGAMNNFRTIGASVYRTDEQGTIVAVSDGKDITWNCSPSETWKAGEPTGSQGTGSGKGQNAGISQGTGDGGNPAGELDAAELAEGSRGAGKNNAGAQEGGYILNTNTKKFHRESCSSVDRIQEENKEYSNLTPQELEAQGYEPCGNCNP